MGVLDHYRIPKKAFYTFRTNWTNVADDHFVLGLTPTRVQLDADLASIIADSTDITRVVGSIRDVGGKCVFAARAVTLQVTGPADSFDPLTKTTIAGKIGWVLKSRKTAGTIRVIGTSSGLAADTITISCVAPDTIALPFVWPVGGRTDQAARNTVSPFTVHVDSRNGRIVLSFATLADASPGIVLCDSKGRVLRQKKPEDPITAIIDTRSLAMGIYLLHVGTAVKRIVLK
jgi:hypothetical protein